MDMVRFYLSFVYLFIGITLFNTAQAQCMFDLAVTHQDVTCPGNGSIQVALSGDEIDLSRNVLVWLKSESGDSILSTTNPSVFRALPAGNYTITATAACRGGGASFPGTATVRVENRYSEMFIDDRSTTDDKTSYRCSPTGSIFLNITGGSSPYQVRMDEKPAEYTGPTVFTQPISGILQIENLYPGNYRFTITDNCGSSKSFPPGGYINIRPNTPVFSIPGATIIPAMKECLNRLGSVSVYMTRGLPPYRITITSKPDEYTGETQFTVNTVGINVSQLIGNLEPGDYVFTVSDSCADLQDTQNISVTIEELHNEFPGISNNASPRLSGCNQAEMTIMDLTNVRLNNYLRQVYNDYGNNCFYEISYTIDGVYTDWVPVCRSVVLNLPSSYRSLYEANKTIEVNLRLLGSTAPECVKTYEIPFAKPSDIINYNIRHDFDACNYKLLNFSVNYMALCTPVSWQLQDSDRVEIANGVGTAINRDLEYDKRYYLRIGDGETYLDTLVYRKKPEPKFYPDGPTQIDRYCDYYHWSFRIDSICPYTWKVYRMLENDTVPPPLITFENGEAGTRYIIENLEYDSVYMFRAYNEDYDTTYVITNRFMDRHRFINYGNLDFQCEDYMFRFQVGSNVKDCPYKWEVLDSDEGTIVYSGEFLSDIVSDPISVRFEYDRNYTIRVINSKRETDSPDTVIVVSPDPWRLDKEKYYKPLLFNQLYEDEINCVDLSYNGYIGFSGPLYNGTRIRFVEGPAGSPDPAHTDVTLTNYFDYDQHFRYYDSFDPHPNIVLYQECATYNRCDNYRNDLSRFNQFYNQNPAYRYLDTYDYYPYYYTYYYNYSASFFPFSQNYRNGEFVPLDEGNYTFAITDRCGNDTTITISYTKKTLTIEDVDITSWLKRENVSCYDAGGARLYPAGNMIDNGIQERLNFRLVDFPENASSVLLNDNDGYGGYFLLNRTGWYSIERSYRGCVIDTLQHYHEMKMLDGIRSLAYVCEEGQAVHIQVEGINGIAPYTYVLCDGARRDLGLPGNNTGIFEWLGEVPDGGFYVKITDACYPSTSSRFIPVEVGRVDQMALIDGIPELCENGTIRLSSYLLGAVNYTWRKEGNASPLATNTPRLIIPGVTPDYTGNYILDIQPIGCPNVISDTFHVEVHPAPPVPQLHDDSLFICRSDMTIDLFAKMPVTPHEDCTIQWYSRNDELLPDGIGDVTREESVFFVVQTNAYGCSSRKRVVVSKSSMARRSIYPSPICEGDSIFFNNIYIRTTGVYRDTIQSEEGCDTILILNLVVNPLSESFMLAVEERPVCYNSEANLTATANAVINPVFRWYAAATGGSLLAEGNPFTTPPLTSNTDYYVSVLGDNYCEGDRRQIQVSIQDSSRISIKSSRDSICQDGREEIVLTATIESGSPSAVAWYDGSETTISNNISIKAHVIPWDEESVYWVHTVDDVCGDSENAFDTVYVTPKIDLRLTADPARMQMGESVTLTVTPTGGEHGDYQWYDYNTRLLIATTTDETLIYPLDAEGRYCFYVVAENGFCPNAESNYECVIAEFIIPNIITPYDGNQRNDTFMKSKDGKPGYRVEIYNRYQQKVFSGEDGWDGTYRGKLAEPGTYYYILWKDGKVYKGTVEVAKF